MTGPKLTVLKGRKDEATHACTWCGKAFLSRADLDQHWVEATRCGRNKTASSPLQSRYGKADLVVEQPGEATLNRIREVTCDHRGTAKSPLINGEGVTFALQCNYCYKQLPPISKA